MFKAILLFIFSLLLMQCDNSTSHIEEEVINYSEIEDINDTLNECDYLIITPDTLFETAKRLANYRNINSDDDVIKASILKLSTIKWYLDNITEETINKTVMFSQLKWLTKPQYIVLLGNNTLDDKLSPSIPFVDESKSNLGDIFYIALADSIYQNVSVGRIPIRNNLEGNNYIDKLKIFESQKTNRILTIADDNWTPHGYSAIKHNVSAQVTLDSVNNSFEKDCFLLESFSKGDTSTPLTPNEISIAKTDLLTKINDDNQIICYYGHNNSSQWSDELILNGKNSDEIKLIKSISLYSLSGNIYKDVESSLSIQLLCKDKGGAVAYIGTAGTAYAASSFLFLNNLWKTATEHAGYSMGDYMSSAMQATGIKNFNYFGDPALKIN